MMVARLPGGEDALGHGLRHRLVERVGAADAGVRRHGAGGEIVRHLGEGAAVVRVDLRTAVAGRIEDEIEPRGPVGPLITRAVS